MGSSEGWPPRTALTVSGRVRERRRRSSQRESASCWLSEGFSAAQGSAASPPLGPPSSATRPSWIRLCICFSPPSPLSPSLAFSAARWLSPPPPAWLPSAALLPPRLLLQRYLRFQRPTSTILQVTSEPCTSVESSLRCLRLFAVPACRCRCRRTLSTARRARCAARRRRSRSWKGSPTPSPPSLSSSAPPSPSSAAPLSSLAASPPKAPPPLTAHPPLLCLCQVLSFLSVALLTAWLVQWREGFSLQGHGRFNLHPLAMTLAVPFLLTHSTLAWRTWPMRSTASHTQLPHSCPPPPPCPRH